jgi:Tol biopolymer transport system component
MPEPYRPSPVPLRPPGSDRLESWKEIAAYLGREVRTVQGWEKNEGLPIHRHQHAKQGSVYAFKSELDAWRQARQNVAELPGPEVETASPPRRTFWIALGVVLVIAIAGAIVAVLLVRPAPEVLRGVPITAALGQELEPSLSPEGSRVAYSWNGEKQDNFDIYVKLIGPGPPLRLTTNPARDSSPVWSPDGRSIAFLRDLGDGKSQVIAIPSLGGPEQIVAEVATWPTPWRFYPGPHLTWAHDGKGLIVSHRPGRNEPFALYSAPLAGGALRQLTHPPAYMAGDTAPVLSPDGRTLIFRRAIGFASGQLFWAPVDEAGMPREQPAVLTPQATSAASPAWMADGRSLIYSDGNYYDPILMRASLPRLKGVPAAAEPLSLAGSFVTTSWAASKLVYASTRFDSDLWEVRLDGAPALNPLTQLSSTRVDSGAQYSPDGTRIAFHSTRSGNPEVWVADRDGKNARQLTSLGDAAAPRWSPDGREIVFLARRNGTEKIYVIGANGGQPRQVTQGPARDHAPNWSRDGRFIYFRSSSSGANEIWKVPAAGGTAVKVTSSGGDLGMEAPDGTLYYTRQAGDHASIWKHTPSGEESEFLPSVYLITNLYVTRTGVYFTPSPAADGSTTIQRRRFSDGKIETLATIRQPIWFGLSVSPDERSILYSQVVREEANLMLVERVR